MPAPPKLTPRSLVSISAKKLSDGVFVSRSSVAIRGEWTEVNDRAPTGVVPALIGVCLGTPTWAARSAATNCWAANSAGCAWNVDSLIVVKPRS